MTAAANLILRIGSELGPGGLASLKAGIDMLGSMVRTVASVIEKVDEYVESMRKADMSMINYADSASKAQIGSLNLMKSFNQMNFAGVKVTRTEFAAMSVAAEEFADVLQIDAASAMDQLTSAVIKGNERGLRPFGIALDENSKKLSGTDQALIQLVRRFGGTQTADPDNLSDAVKGLKNNSMDMFGAIWDGLTKTRGPVTDFLNYLSEAIGNVGKALSELTNTQKQYLWSTDYLLDTVKIAWGDYLKIFGGKDWEAAIDIMKSDATNRMLGLLQESVSQKNAEAGASVLGRAPNTLGWDRPKGKKHEYTDDEIRNMIWDAYAQARNAALQGGPRPVSTFQPIAQDLGGMGELFGSTMEFNAGAGGMRYNADREKESLEYQVKLNEFLDRQILSQKELNDLKQQYLDMDALIWQTQNEFVDGEAANQEAKIEYLREQDALEEELGYKQLEKIKLLEEQREAEAAYFNSTEGHIERLIDITDQFEASYMSLRGSIMMVADAWEKGTKGMTKAQAVFYYIDAVIGAALEIAKAAAAFAKPFGSGAVEGALHVVAAAAYITAAALASSHGGSSSSGQTALAGGPATTAGRYSGGYDRGSESSTINVYVTLDGEQIHKSVVVQNQRAARSGNTAFQEAA